MVSAAITQYVHVTMHRTPLPEMLLRYSQIERTKTVAEIRHPIIREALKLTGIVGPNIEITSMADIPAGTGLGSSGSFATCLLKVLHKFKRHFIHPRQLPRWCAISRLIRWASRSAGPVHRGVRRDDGVRIAPDGQVAARSVAASEETLDLLEQNLVMVSTGFYRSAGQVLKEQDERSRANDRAMIDNLHFVKELGRRSLAALEAAT